MPLTVVDIRKNIVDASCTSVYCITLIGQTNELTLTLISKHRFYDLSYDTVLHVG